MMIEHPDVTSASNQHDGFSSSSICDSACNTFAPEFKAILRRKAEKEDDLASTLRAERGVAVIPDRLAGSESRRTDPSLTRTSENDKDFENYTWRLLENDSGTALGPVSRRFFLLTLGAFSLSLVVGESDIRGQSALPRAAMFSRRIGTEW
jgi:hypothetical protein